jgi:hypothetical protein
MSLGDSILQTASIARWVSVAVTATDHTIFGPAAQGRDSPGHKGRDSRASDRDLCYALGAKSSGPYI